MIIEIDQYYTYNGNTNNNNISINNSHIAKVMLILFNKVKTMFIIF